MRWRIFFWVGTFFLKHSLSEFLGKVYITTTNEQDKDHRDIIDNIRFMLIKSVMKIIASGIVVVALFFSITSSRGERQKIYSDVDSFKTGLVVGVSEERNIDINNDGRIDVLIFSSGGEETYLDILIKEQDHFVHINIPVGESYEIVRTPKNYELKVGFGTFPTFGDIHGAGKYYWYDFYEIVGVTLTNRNSRHREFYRDMKKQYEKRIKELEKEIETYETNKAEKGADIVTLDLWAQLTRDHIQRYREFIQKALTIIQGKAGT